MSTEPADQEFDVFLSHHSGDKPWVIVLKSELAKRNVRVWLDQDEIRPGDLYMDALADGVRRSRCVAVIVSPGSVRSRWVKREWQTALKLSDERGTRIIPCILGDAPLPDFVDLLQAIDFRDSTKYKERVDQLHDAIVGGETRRAHIDDRASEKAVWQKSVTDREVAYLNKSIAYANKDWWQLATTRAAAPVVGLAAASMVPPLAGIHWALPFIGCAVVTGSLGYGVTAQRLSDCIAELKKLRAHRDALEFCSHDLSDVCDDIKERFDELIRERAGAPSSGTRRERA